MQEDDDFGDFSSAEPASPAPPAAQPDPQSPAPDEGWGAFESVREAPLPENLDLSRELSPAYSVSIASSTSEISTPFPVEESPVAEPKPPAIPEDQELDGVEPAEAKAKVAETTTKEAVEVKEKTGEGSSDPVEEPDEFGTFEGADAGSDSAAPKLGISIAEKHDESGDGERDLSRAVSPSSEYTVSLASSPRSIPDRVNSTTSTFSTIPEDHTGDIDSRPPHPVPSLFLSHSDSSVDRVPKLELSNSFSTDRLPDFTGIKASDSPTSAYSISLNASPVPSPRSKTGPKEETAAKSPSESDKEWVQVSPEDPSSLTTSVKETSAHETKTIETTEEESWDNFQEAEAAPISERKAEEIKESKASPSDIPVDVPAFSTEEIIAFLASLVASDENKAAVLLKSKLPNSFGKERSFSSSITLGDLSKGFISESKTDLVMANPVETLNRLWPFSEFAGLRWEGSCFEKLLYQGLGKEPPVQKSDISLFQWEQKMTFVHRSSIIAMPKPGSSADSGDSLDVSSAAEFVAPEPEAVMAPRSSGSESSGMVSAPGSTGATSPDGVPGLDTQKKLILESSPAVSPKEKDKAKEGPPSLKKQDSMLLSGKFEFNLFGLSSPPKKKAEEETPTRGSSKSVITEVPKSAPPSGVAMKTPEEELSELLNSLPDLSYMLSKTIIKPVK